MPTHLRRKEMMEMHPPACPEGWLSAHTPVSMNTVIHLHVYEHKQHYSFTRCLWTQTVSFIYHMSMNTNSIIHLPHVHEHKQHCSFTTCPWTQPVSFMYHMFLNTTSTPELQSPHWQCDMACNSFITVSQCDMACNSFITVSIRFCCRSESLYLLTSMCMQNAVTAALPDDHYFTDVQLWDHPSST